MSTTSEEFPPELPEVDPIFIPYFPSKTGGEREKIRKMEGSGNYNCVVCQFEAANENELEVHTNACLDKEENRTREHENEKENQNEVVVSDDEEENKKRRNGGITSNVSDLDVDVSDDEEETKKKRNGGITSNVPDLDDDVEYQGFAVKFKRVVLTGLVETAKQNLYEIQAGIVRYKWNKGCFYAWLFENVEGSENYTKSTLKRRVEKVEKEAERFIMTKKEGSKTGQGKMTKKIDPDLHSERQDTYVEPKNQDEEEMKELGTTFAHLRREINETQFKQKSKKGSPQQEAKARKLSSMLDDSEDLNKDDDDEDRENDADEEGKKSVPTIKQGTLFEKPSNMAEKGRRKREESIKVLYEQRQEQRRDPAGKEKKESKIETVESVVIDAFKTVKDSFSQRNQAPYPQQGIPPYMPYPYPYPGFMGAPSPFSLPMQMPSPQMFQQPMSQQRPDAQVKEAAQSVPLTASNARKTCGAPMTVRISGDERDGLSSSEHAPAERPLDRVITSVTEEEEVDPSSYEHDTARGRISVPGLPSGRTSVISSAACSSGQGQPATGQTPVKKSTKIHSNEVATGEKSKSSSPANAPQSTGDSSAMNDVGMSSQYGYQFMPGQSSPQIFGHPMAPQSGQISLQPSSTHMMAQFLPGQMSPPPTSPDMMTQEASQISPELASTLTAQQVGQTSQPYPGMMSPPQIAHQMMIQQMLCQQLLNQQMIMNQQFGHASPSMIPQFGPVSPPMIPRSPPEMMSPGSALNSGASESKKGNKKAPSTKGSDVFNDTD